mmetsp:Transcript_30607/g.52386  ORF Transcript_30607/g.52386 Transcript_30607/m.52386 type:complete len:150 (+) Transcript_30607:3-452(+)
MKSPHAPVAGEGGTLSFAYVPEGKVGGRHATTPVYEAKGGEALVHLGANWARVMRAKPGEAATHCLVFHYEVLEEKPKEPLLPASCYNEDGSLVLHLPKSEEDLIPDLLPPKQEEAKEEGRMQETEQESSDEPKGQEAGSSAAPQKDAK